MTTGEPTRPRTGSNTSVPRRAPSASGSSDGNPSGVEDDIFERLARVGESPSAGAPVGVGSPIDPLSDVGVLPPIVEAEPLVTMPTQRTDAVRVPAPTPLAPVIAAPGVTAVPSIAGQVAPDARARRTVAFRRPRPRVRRVTRVVRHVDTWSVFKVALVFNTVLYLVCLVAGVLLWNVATATGTVDNIEQFFEQFGWESFEFNGGELYHNAWIAGLFVAVGLTGLAVLVATVFNLITDLVGGIRVSVLEEEVVARDAVAGAGGNVRDRSG